LHRRFSRRQGRASRTTASRSSKDRRRGDSDDSSAPSNPFARIWRGFLGMCMWLAGLVLKVVMAVQDMVRDLSRKVLVALLRSSLAASLVTCCSLDHYRLNANILNLPIKLSK
jgi:hypothetical protein